MLLILKRFFQAAVLAFAAFTAPAHANLTSALDGMWYGSAGGTVAGDNGMGLYGPSVSLRGTNRNYQIAYFDPPRFSAGCSNVDAIFGSFSMLSISQMGELIRKIMQNAPSYLLKLAIKAMCEDCASTLEGLQALANQINSMQMNSCQISESLFNAVKDDVMSDTGGNTKSLFESGYATAKGMVENTWSAIRNTFERGDKANRDAAKDESTDNYNVVFNTIYTTGAQNKINFDVFGGEQKSLEIIQSIIGTKIVSNADTGASGAVGDANSGDQIKEGTIKFLDIVDGANNTREVTYIACRDFTASATGCQSIREKKFDYKGVRKYLVEKLAGAQPVDSNGDPILGLQEISDTSILGKLQKGEPLTAAQQNIISSLPVGLGGFLVELNRVSKSSKTALYNAAIAIAADEIAASAALGLASAVQSAYNTNRKDKIVVPLSERQRARLQEFINDAIQAKNNDNKVARLNQLFIAIQNTKRLEDG